MMFLHLGNEVLIPTDNIIIIGDSNICDKMTREKINDSPIPKGKQPKAAVITDQAVYLSIISPLTLMKRANSPFSENE